MDASRIWGIGVAVALAVVGGCAAGQKPCMVIPAQIELARDVRDAAEGELESKQADLARIRTNLEQSKLHLARLIEEREQLKKEVGGSPAGAGKEGAPASGGEQKPGGSLVPPPPGSERKSK